jgi:hypothetical protein
VLISKKEAATYRAFKKWATTSINILHLIIKHVVLILMFIQPKSPMPNNIVQMEMTKGMMCWSVGSWVESMGCTG